MDKLPPVNDPAFRNSVERALSTKRTHGQDIEVGDARIILRSPNGTRYAIVVDNAGVLSTVAV